MFIDREEKIIKIPFPEIEPVDDSLRNRMEFILQNPKEDDPNISYVTLRRSGMPDWHTDHHSTGEYTLELASTSTTTLVASVIINYTKLDRALECSLLEEPGYALDLWLGSRWIEKAVSGVNLETKTGITVVEAEISQLLPFHVARGDAGSLLHRASEWSATQPKNRVLFRQLTPI